MVKKLFYVILCLLLLESCGSSSIRTTKSGTTRLSKNFKNNVQATYYADKFNGRKTANGTTFNNNNLTAAHRQLPFGTIVRVTNLANNKSVEVEINDRGPVKTSREIDLSKKAFMLISDNKNHGLLSVKIEIVN